jgi:hypothetical protein
MKPGACGIDVGVDGRNLMVDEAWIGAYCYHYLPFWGCTLRDCAC